MKTCFMHATYCAGRKTAAFSFFKELAVQVDRAGNLQPFDAALLPACAHGLTAYDASYFEVALREGLPHATLDAPLRTAATAAGVQLHV